jgi:hypothetical protein
MRLGWAKLLKRVFNLDLTHCPHCGGDLRMIAAIMQRQALKYSGCEGGFLECELAQIDADFQRYFCASKAVLPIKSIRWAVMQSSQTVISHGTMPAAVKKAFESTTPRLRWRDTPEDLQRL